MIDSLQLKNFKCFRDQRIPLGGLTILAGMNGAGKSSVIHAILVLYQLARAKERPQEPLVSLGSFHDVLHDNASDDTVQIEIAFRNGETYRHHLSYEDPDLSSSLHEKFNASNASLPLAYPMPSELRSFSMPINIKMGLGGAGKALLEHGNIYYISADRLGPRRTLPYVDGEATSLGKRGEHVLRYLDVMGNAPTHPAVRNPNEPKKTIVAQTSAWLSVISPGVEPVVKVISEADCAVASYRYKRPADVPSPAFRPENVGFGVSYALPPIVALLAPKVHRLAEGVHLTIIENPEAHIHPSGQTSLAELAAKAVAGGSQVILETHSDHVLNGVRLAVVDGIIDPDDVTIHYFEREGLDVKIKTPSIARNGKLDMWPQGFFDQHEQNLSRLIGIPE